MIPYRQLLDTYYGRLFIHLPLMSVVRALLLIYVGLMSIVPDQMSGYQELMSVDDLLLSSDWGLMSMEEELIAFDDHHKSIVPDQMSGVKVLKSFDETLMPIVNSQKPSAEIRGPINLKGTAVTLKWHGCHSKPDSLIFEAGFKTGLLGDDFWSNAPDIP